MFFLRRFIILNIRNIFFFDFFMLGNKDINTSILSNKKYFIYISKSNSKYQSQQNITYIH